MPSALEIQLQARREQQQQIVQTPRHGSNPLGHSQTGNLPRTHQRSSLFSDDFENSGLGPAGLSESSSLNHSSPASQSWLNTPSHGNQSFPGFANGFGSDGISATGVGFDFEGSRAGSNFNFTGAQTVTMDLSSAFMERLKSMANLTPEAKGVLNRYLEAPTLAERLALHFTQNLVTQSLLQQLADNREASWEVSVSLKKVIAKHAKAFVLSSTAKFYIKCTPSPDQILVSALRTSNLKDLPDEDDFAANAVLKSAVSHSLTQARSMLKDQIVATTSQCAKGQLPAEECDLGTLAQTVIAGTDAIPNSLALMHRLAVMRNVIDNESSTNARDFWPKVDAEMTNLLGIGRTPPKSEQEILNDFRIVYQIDTEKYGAPSVSPTNIGDATYKWAKYVKTINNLVAKAASDSEGGGRSNGKKRKRRVGDVGRAGRSRANVQESDEEELPDEEKVDELED
ncbi:hypothetical protein C8R42DRAFT_639042 [Lentinula raphanica]|nr:hypothetical protein C8R42DRAFT_639042 [Lentinula raphanica]